MSQSDEIMIQNPLRLQGGATLSPAMKQLIDHTAGLERARPLAPEPEQEPAMAHEQAYEYER